MRKKSTYKKKHGFTLIAIIISMIILSISAVSIITFTSTVVKREKETEFIYRINTVRTAITTYRKSTGHYPSTLEDMMQAKYFRQACMKDPITGANWELIYSSLSEGYGIKDIKSKSTDKAMMSKDGKPVKYNEY